MELYYFWNDKIPSKTDKTLAPNEYFETLLYKDDRFSWIQENYLELLSMLSGVTKEAGYDFQLFYADETRTYVVGCVTYVKHGSPAETAGLKRGDLFLTVNGTQMTVDNYVSLINDMSANHTLGLADGSTLSLTAVVFSENPVYLDTIYSVGSQNIGYLVYNFFSEDSGDNSYQYEKELNAIFGKFKAANIDDLILDLRYNGGGSVSTAVNLASMISGKSTGDIFGITQYNSLLTNYFTQEYGADFNKTYFSDDIIAYDSNGAEIVVEHLNKLSLGRLFVIGTGGTASASELIINGLKPYITVTLIGETTYGKNVGSITIYEDDAEKQKTNKWGMQPIVVKFANKNGFSDYGSGFTPDIEASEFTTAFFKGEEDMKPLGDRDEAMLNVAINRILGNDTGVKSARSVKRTIEALPFVKNPARQNMYIDLHKSQGVVKSRIER
jgi:C-terminal processing protease CtpA/Prc